MMRALALLTCLVFGAGCGLKYDGVSAAPYPQGVCEDKGCAWNPAKARCECWNRPNADGRSAEKGANF